MAGARGARRRAAPGGRARGSRAVSSSIKRSGHYTQVPKGRYERVRAVVRGGCKVGLGADSSVTSKSVRPRLHTVYTLKQVPQQSGPYCLQRGAARQAKHKTEDDPVRSARFRHGVDSCGLREDYRETQPRELSS